MFVEPLSPNPRRELQKGLFLVGLNLSKSLEENLFGCLGYLPAEANPTIGANGIPTGPVGFYTMPLNKGSRANIADALIVQIELAIPAVELGAYLRNRGVSDASLGLEVGPQLAQPT
ncbi:MAG: hypothetical protein WD851_00055 [Pirellulales bacterium]